MENRSKMRQSAFFQTFRSILLRQGSASAIFALQKSLNAQRNKGISTARTRIVAFGLRKELKIFCRNPSPRPLVRPLTTLPVGKVGRFNFEPLELPANRRIFLTRYGDSLYFAPAHIVSVNRQPPAIRLAYREGSGRCPCRHTSCAKRCHPSACFCRFFVESWAFCGLSWFVLCSPPQPCSW